MKPLLDVAECSRCFAACHDVLQYGTRALVACSFCGMRIRIGPVYEPLESERPNRSGSPCFESGRYAGKSIAQVDAEPNGRAYLEFQIQGAHPLRPAIEAYLKELVLTPVSSAAR